LYAVSADSANDAWAVGVNQGRTLVERWKGSGWSRVSSPSVGPYGNELLGVSALSPKNVWAVGSRQSSGLSGYDKTLIEHWNGSTWSVKKSPSPKGGAILSTISAESANDIWAVGEHGKQTLIERWNGSSWSVVASANPGPSWNDLVGVVAFDASNAWAVGTQNSHGSPTNLVERWDGSSWQTESSPDPVSMDQLLGVNGTSPTDIWAVGSTYGGSGEFLHRC
jgi:hypothetical protein